MTSESRPSFSVARKWSLSLNLAVLLLTVLALLVMVNYLAARHFGRWSWSANAQAELSPLSLRVLAGVTNPVKVTLYFDKRDPLFDMSRDLLKVYRYANDRIQVQTIDYNTEPGAAEVVKARHKLGQTDRDMIIFECLGRPKFVFRGELSDLDIQSLVTGQSAEVRRTHFRGEMLFTSAILTVINPRPSKAYFLVGHDEHDPESDDGVMGYSRFAGVLRENNVQFDKLNLAGPGEVPADCNLLIIAGARSPLPPEVLEKIDRYLKQGRGGRMLVLFFSYAAWPRLTGLEAALANWGVAVGRNVVRDDKGYVSPNKEDMVVATFGTHPLIKPIYGYQLYFVLPRSIEKDLRGGASADAPQVVPLVYTSGAGCRITDVRPGGHFNPGPSDEVTNVSLAVAVEKGALTNVLAERGTTRLVVAGDSLFLNNNNIDREANYQFASHAINWLLARNELLVGVPPKPITDYKLTMTAAQLTTARWVLMGAFPGSALLLGALVWLRRRR